MKLYAYVDESGTFDQYHNDLFVYGGIVVPGKEAKDNLERRYIDVESNIRENSAELMADDEVKASLLTMRERKRLYKVVEKSPCYQFGVVVNQRELSANVFADKRFKQRYLDWALKMGLKRCLLSMLDRGAILEKGISKVAVFVDEHSSSTSGKYNLHDSINEELRCGMYSANGVFHEPVFSPKLPEISVNYLDSKTVTLIRAADITANWIFCAERDRVKYPHAFDCVQREAVIYRHP